MMFMELVLRVKMRHEFDEGFGPVHFSLSYRKKVILASFSFGEKVLLVSCEEDADIGDMPFRILGVLNKTKDHNKQIDLIRNFLIEVAE